MMSTSGLRGAVLALCVTAGLLTGAAAHAAYPDRPIRLLLGYPPGGAADAVARSVAPKMAQQLGQPVVVEYKSGAGGAIAAESEMRADADGYTLHLIDSSAMVVLPNIRKVNFDPLASFTPVGGVAAGGLVLAVNPAVPARTLKEFVALLREHPEHKYSYATSGVGGGSHIAAELFKFESGITMQHIAYRGGGPAMADLISGQIPVGMSTLAPAIPMIKAGKIIALGVTSSTRAEALPDVPTIAEQGYAGYESLTWYGLVGPKNLDSAIVQRLQGALQEALKDPSVQALLREQGLAPMSENAEAFMARVKQDLAKYGAVVRKADIRPE